MNKGNTYLLNPGQINRTRRFLINIPPFPLDISAAAHYLKTTSLSQEEYLERLNAYNKNFENIQQNILKEVSEYDKTRYKIIQISLEKIIKINKNFIDFLLLITLINSQNIPRNLLDIYKDDVVIDDFLFHLKRYSLITNESKIQSIKTFSIHRCTQEICLIYLSQLLKLTGKPEKIEIVGRNFEASIAYMLEKEDYKTLKILVNHCEKFLSHSSLLTNNIKASIGSELGCIYCLLSYEQIKTKQMLEINLQNLINNDSKNYLLIAQSSLYLGILYREQGYYQKAIDFMEQSLKIYQHLSSKNHNYIAGNLTYLGDMYRKIGDFEKAKSLIRQSLNKYKTIS